jgi:hypothetical protein
MIRLMFMLAVLGRFLPFLKTNAGNDVQARQMASAGAAASATAVLKWMGLTANVTGPAAGDTTLAAEIVTAGLTRQAAALAHTTATNTYTVTGTFTAQAGDVPITVGKMGVFDALAAGNLGFTTLVSPTATLSAAGDVLTVTQTVTM